MIKKHKLNLTIFNYEPILAIWFSHSEQITQVLSFPELKLISLD